MVYDTKFIFNLVASTLGILGFILSVVLAIIEYIKFKESREKIEIDVLYHNTGGLVDRVDGKNTYRLIPAFLMNKLSKKNFRIEISYNLINKTDKPITIYGLDYYWVYPKFEDIFKRHSIRKWRKYLTDYYRMDSNLSGDPFRRTNIVVEAGKAHYIKDYVYAGSIASSLIIRKI